MKYKKYISTAFLAFLLLQIELGFDTNDYLPEDFNPYKEEVPVNGINFMEEETIDLGFETADYLPENFNPYRK